MIILKLIFRIRPFFNKFKKNEYDKINDLIFKINC